VSPRELSALGRRHLFALSLVLLVAVATAYTFKRTPPVYQESATVVLTAPKSLAYPNPYTSFGQSLITTGEIMQFWINGAEGKQRLRQAGVASGLDVSLVNLYNQQYPYYGEPYLTVSATGQDPASAHRVFATGTGLLEQNLAARQASQGVKPTNRIAAHTIGDTGPIITPGSRKRSFPGLVLLTIVAAFMVTTFLDRHPVRLRRLLGSLLGLRRLSPGP